MALIASLSRLMLLQFIVTIKTDIPACYLPGMGNMATPALLMALKAMKPETQSLFMTFEAVSHSRFDLFVRIMAGIAVKLHGRIQIRWKRHCGTHLLMTGKANLPLRDQGGSAF